MKLLKFEQSNCNPCKMVTQFLIGKGIEYETINVEHDPDAASDFGIMGVPVTILLNDEGTEVKRVVGYKPQDIDEMIAQL